MTVHTLMWEARATQGRGADLLEWTRTRAAELAEATPSPLRTELFQASQDRVLCLTWWHPEDGPDLPELPEPPAELITRAVHRWRFEAVEVWH
ncbi:hypothetical protein CLM85_17885 [Streptomyces albidoflavus]|uniref:hypothetical protein n=1 Tax=Streptomyces albidoflavus TaxID=1886 RepID=UPI000BAE5CB8|nr:hypothetical protein [Streptomyces albidoflavus]PAX82712.1 hypothetical protein CLM81_26245 [Streptomyces albidoflavus]PAX92044.1 hypothetical protein CLM82_05830 [Streptomyces albidoflavus]PBO16180.1 hypothetical protein CLM83_25440 [Streptomyces albidoflavus]PBO23132.1 hypothetical protein CLM85_17885 [Streptomyces albidoflavus]PBO27274.1 hypothetical protein CLM84_26700 [Streptomyces albidoflavus]